MDAPAALLAARRRRVRWRCHQARRTAAAAKRTTAKMMAIVAPSLRIGRGFFLGVVEELGEAVVSRARRVGVLVFFSGEEGSLMGL